MKRRGFTLVELLVAIAIILVLATLASVAAAAARGSVRQNATRSLIERLNGVLLEHIAFCERQNVDVSARPSTMSAAAYRAWYIRRNLINGDMPDRWSDVEFIYQNTDFVFNDGLSPAQTPPSSPVFPKERLTPSQLTYLGIWRRLVTSNRTAIVQIDNSSAECLFMVVMQGGIGDCTSCGPVQTGDKGAGSPRIGDKDGDGMPEFQDAWGNPIQYLLWAPALELPPDSGTKFFSGSRALDPNAFPASGAVRPTLGMRPLIFSPGPDDKSGLRRPGSNNGSVEDGYPTLAPDLDCGNPYGLFKDAGGPSIDLDKNPPSARNDNITNFDAEIKP